VGEAVVVGLGEITPNVEPGRKTRLGPRFSGSCLQGAGLGRVGCSTFRPCLNLDGLFSRLWPGAAEAGRAVCRRLPGVAIPANVVLFKHQLLLSTTNLGAP